MSISYSQRKNLKGTVQVVTHLKKCELKTELEVLYCIVLYCIQRKIYKGIWCYYTFTVSYRKQPESILFGTPDFLKNVVTHPVISGKNKSSSVHETFLPNAIDQHRAKPCSASVNCKTNTSISDLSHKSQ
jgi:hypothetical protein